MTHVQVESHWYPKVALLMLLIGFLFQLIAYGAPHWSQTDASTIRREHFGLWKYCTYPIGGNQHCDDFINLASIGGRLIANVMCPLPLFFMSVRS